MARLTEEDLQRRSEKKEWRTLFTAQELEEAKKFSGSFVRFGEGWFGMTSRIRDRSYVEVSITAKPRRITDSWNRESFHCTCPQGKKGQMCAHMAATMLRWEKEHGPLIIEENESDWKERVLAYRMQQEADRRDRLWDRLHGERVSAAEALGLLGKKQKGLVFIDLPAALTDYWTNGYYLARREEERKNSHEKPRFVEETLRDGTQRLTATWRISTEDDHGSLEYVIAGGKIVRGSSDVELSKSLGYGLRIYESQGWFDPEDVDADAGEEAGKQGEDIGGADEEEDLTNCLDEFELLLLEQVAEYLKGRKEQDLTDEAAMTFFKQMDKKEKPEAIKQVQASSEKEPVVEIAPRIIIEDGEAKVSFKLGRKGGRLFVLRNLVDFVDAVHREGMLQVTKKESLDFGRMDIHPDSVKWMEFIQRRVGSIADANRKIMERTYYGSAATLSANYQQELKGSTLDHFYDAAEGGTCEYQDKTNNVQEAQIRVGHTAMHFTLKVDRLCDARGQFAGAIVSGFVPVLIKGSSARYILNHAYLSKITPEENKALAPFLKVADPSGYFRFQVGMEHMQELYYRILPELMENPAVELEDHCGDEARAYLPPEPRFVFSLDLEESVFSVAAEVSYGEKSYTLTAEEPKTKEYRDTAQEARVRKAITMLAPRYDEERKLFYKKVDEEQLFDLLESGVSFLSKYGTVQGTDAFRRQSVRKTPPVTVGISVHSGIMDLQVTAKDVDEKELLELLASYQKKKRFHRLKSGEFVDLTDADELNEVNKLLASMDLVPTDVIKGKAHLPLYRAIYLDRMLEEHDRVITSRDRTYRALVRNFRTIKDSEDEVPESLADVLRPYQAFGYKWLRTLAANGFGGILADEMGLGKTLQMIAYFLGMKQDGEEKPALVVCPASLVYNWQEEIRRFAPSLTAVPVSGGLAARKKLLSQTEADVYITSYDLLKRDVALYTDRQFSACVLDEAQFIKNQKAAVSKAVKAIQAKKRFALTGTPIENRLSELWSIFDFLMPGFLYGSEEFIRRLETPIAKYKDEAATEKLKKMVSPFILRRRKEEVLKDLPEKLEEVRFARFAGEQQKLYDSQVLHMKQMLGTMGPGGEEKMRVFAELTRIRQICCDPSLLFEDYGGESAKREACLELIKSAIDGGHRMLVFSQFTSMLALLEEELKNEGIPYLEITGATPKEKRIALVHTFNEGDVPVFLISLKAGGTGLNLTGADVVIHYDPWWNLAVQNQATDRAHRIGQTRQVTVYKLIMKDTIEERILELQEAKRDLAEAILEGQGESLLSLSREELLQLLS